jgi:nitrate reductase gamma subunit
MENKPAKKFDSVLVIGYIVVVLIHLVGYLVTRTTPDMSQLEVDQLGTVKIVSGILGIISIIAMYIITVKRTRNKPKCPSCGADPQSPSDKICRACGASLVN